MATLSFNMFLYTCRENRKVVWYKIYRIFQVFKIKNKLIFNKIRLL